MAVYMQEVDVTATSAYPAKGSQQVTIPFEPKRIVVLNMNDTKDAYVSFDGVNDAGRAPAVSKQALEYRGPYTTVFLKREAAGGAGKVQVIAES